MKPALSTRQAEIAQYVAKGLPDKVSAERTGLSVHTVREYIQKAAARLPGEGWPRQRLLLWVLNAED